MSVEVDSTTEYQDTVLGKLPMDWAISTVEECCEILDSKRVPLNAIQRKTMQGKIPYYGANGLLDHINDFIFEEPLILMAEDGGYFDEYQTRPIAYMISGKSWVNNHAHVLKSKSGYSQEFLYYQLVHKNILPFINAGTRSKLNQGDLRKLPLAITALPEQKKIAAILGCVDEAIEKTEAVIAATQKLKQGLMQRLLTRGIGHTEFKDSPLGKIPKSWEVLQLGDIADFVNGRGFKPHEWKTTGYPIIRIQNLNGSPEFNYFQGKFDKKLLVHNGDLLFAWSGSRGTSFGPHIWNGETGVLNYHTWNVKYSENVNRDFLYFALGRLTVQIEGEAHGASALVHTQKIRIVKYRLAFPPPAEQEAISHRLSHVNVYLSLGLREIAFLRNVKSALMQKLLTGKVRVTVKSGGFPEEDEAPKTANYQEADALPMKRLKASQETDSTKGYADDTNLGAKKVSAAEINKTLEGLGSKARVREIDPNENPFEGMAVATLDGPAAFEEMIQEGAYDRPECIDDWEADAVMAEFRQACRQEGACSREQLLKAVSINMGFKRHGSHIDIVLRNHLRAAIRRKIVGADGNEVYPETKSMADYTQDELVEILQSVMRPGTKYQREDVQRALAHHLGFRRLTDTVLAPLKSAINGAIRRRALSCNGEMLWKAQK